MCGRAFSVVLAVAFFALTSLATSTSKRDDRPNIIFILTDDQDYLLGSMDHMPVLQEQLIQQGTLFTKHYGHVSQCCPSRASMWTGKHAHNTNITSINNAVPGGGWQHIQQFGLHNKYLPVYLQGGGYNVYYSGKIYNGYTSKNFCNPVCLEGFTRADLLVEPRTYSYYNSTFVHYDLTSNWTQVKKVTGYSTDVITENVLNYIDDAKAAGKPFMAVAAPISPHMSIKATYPNNKTNFPYPLPKAEYADLFQDLVMPKSPNFNPDNRTGVAGVWALEQLSDGNVAILDEFYRNRQRCLMSVDDMITAIVQKLTDTGLMDNTYIIYTADNGYHIGNHRLQPGKLQCFEEDVNLPFIIRGPTVAKNFTTDLVSGHIDIVPTILTLAGVDINPTWALDGQAITFPLATQSDFQRNIVDRGETTHLEFWGPMEQEGMFARTGVDFQKNLQIYKALRIQGEGYNLMYSVWCQDNAHELYDMSWDPYQLTNLHPQAPVDGNGENAFQKGMNTVLGRPIEDVINRLDALVLVQKTCVGDVCRRPWQQLHPTDNVTSLMDALSDRHDAYYNNSFAIAKVGWQQCFTGFSKNHSATLYDLDNEHPLWLNQTIVQLVQKGNAAGTISAPWADQWVWFAYLWGWIGLWTLAMRS